MAIYFCLRLNDMISPNVPRMANWIMAESSGLAATQAVYVVIIIAPFKYLLSQARPIPTPVGWISDEFVVIQQDVGIGKGFSILLDRLRWSITDIRGNHQADNLLTAII